MDPKAQHSDWDAVDQASLESFPASDPPARGTAHAAPSESTVAAPEHLAYGRKRRALKIALAVVSTGIALGGMIVFGPRLRRRFF